MAQRALILMYHQVAEPRADAERRLCTPPAVFARQMAYLRAASFCPISLAELVSGMRGESDWPARPIHVTFDDGFADLLHYALPVLVEHAIPATYFIVSGRIGDTNHWMRSRGYPLRKLADAAELELLHTSGGTIGSHSRTHPFLPQLGAAGLRREIRDSKAELEDVTGRPVAYFAYPYGRFTEAVRDAVADAGYEGACTTLSGFNRSDGDPFQLRRIEICGTDRTWQFRQKLHFGVSEADRARRLRYYSGRLAARLRPGTRGARAREEHR